MSTLNDNTQKTPLAQSLQRLGEAKANDATQALGKGLPCSVVKIISPGIVTVKFEVTGPAPLPQITMPVAKSPYIQFPIQVGDKGQAIPSAVRLGGLSGLGSGVPSLTDTVGNLGALAFHPMADTGQTTLDPEALVLHGNIIASPDALGFFATAKVGRQTVTGPLSSVTDASAKAVLTSLLQALSAYGLITNSTT